MPKQIWPARAINWRTHWSRTPGTVSVNDAVECAMIYWGANPRDPSELRGFEVRNPPVHGWSTVLLLRNNSTVDLLHPASMQTFTVSHRAQELRDRVHVHPKVRSADEWSKKLLMTWAEFRKLKVMFDPDVIGRFIIALGGERPAEDETYGSTRLRGGGKDVKVVDEALPEAERPVIEIKPMKRDGKRAVFLLYALEIMAAGRVVTVKELMDKFGMTRNNALSYLFQLNKDQGVGYALSGDVVTITLPRPIEELLK